MDPLLPDIGKTVDCDGIVALTGSVDQTGLSIEEVELGTAEQSG